MSEADRTSIHEVMEQQTISVAKAGILTTLNARVSIVAAANPVYGRYNTHRTLEQNIQLPSSLLSRFDLLWLLRDVPNVDHDLCIAKHIVNVHSGPMNNECSEVGESPNPSQGLRRSQRLNASRRSRAGVRDDEPKPLDMACMRRIIAVCRNGKVTVPRDLMQYLIGAYVQMREESRGQRDTSEFTSPRTLLALLRLASAHAKLRLSDTMNQEDVDEAIRLTEKSRETLNSWVNARRPTAVRATPSDQIFVIVRNLLQEQTSSDVGSQLKHVPYQLALEQCVSKGFTRQQFEQAIQDYERLNVVSLVQNGKTISVI